MYVRPIAALYAVLLLGLPIAAGAAASGPPDGTYAYAMTEGGKVLFKSTIVVSRDPRTMTVTETTGLPNGAHAVSRTVWSRATMLPESFEIVQGKVDVRGRFTSNALAFARPPIAFLRMPKTLAVLPSVGLISTYFMYPYVAAVHPGASFTLAEVQNQQTVLLRPAQAGASSRADGDVAIALRKNEYFNNDADQEFLTFWCNPKTSVIDEIQNRGTSVAIKRLP